MWPYIVQRTQISLTEAGRRALDAASARTGRSTSALIREAVDAVYGGERSAADDLATLQKTFGAWTPGSDDEADGAARVDAMRSGQRLQRSS